MSNSLTVSPHGDGPPRETDAADVGQRALALVGRSNTRIAGWIAESKAFTEREVLGCGDELSTLVDTVRGLIAESDQQAANEAAHAREVAARFVNGMQEDMAAQHTAVREVLALADGIQAATAAIERLTQMSHILALNMRIEAARAGEHGRGFAVIATQMRDMAGTIRTASDDVATAVAGVRAGLPTVMAQSASMQERARRFIAEITAQGEADRSGVGANQSARLDSVMALSNAALSHLQFFDPLVKQLGTIAHEIDDCEHRLQRIVNGDDTLLGDDAWVSDAELSASAPLSDTPVPGGLLLF
jgi:ElaB/YqjD/DUF883 family membrane-anchored ribosome-binding protein